MASALILVPAVLFGISNILAKVGYAHAVTPLTLLSLRATSGGLIAWLGLAVTKRMIPLPWALFAPLLALGMTIIPFQTFSYFYALSMLPASSVSVSVHTAPIHVAWMGWWFLGESSQPTDVAILVAIVGGAVLVAGQTPHTGHTLARGALVTATVVYAFYMVAQRRLVRDVSPLRVLSVVLPSSAAVYRGAGLVTRQIHLSMALPALLAVAGSTIAASLGLFFVLVALQVISATRTTMLGMLEPVVTVVLASCCSAT
jgi:drug/metabolite transporter (DMT)-like permease